MLYRRMAPLLLALPCLLLAACGTSSSAADSTPKANQVAIKLVDSGCSPDSLNLPAGTTTFKVSNGGTSKVTELEIDAGSKIDGEAENVVGGISRTFTLNLQPGTYAIHCPGGSNTKDGTLTVTGSASSTTLAGDAAGAVSNYRDYVSQQVQLLVTNTKTFTDAVVAGNVAQAKALYPTTRTYYERIEPVAESFSDLDTAIDARADDTPVDQISGFHRIENALWTDNSTAGMTPVAQKLYSDVQTLQSRIPTIQLDPATIANGANGLLGEVSQSKVTGEEERYSHLDLYDLAANVDGSEAAMQAVRPLLDRVDPALGQTIDARYAQVEKDLTPYKTSNGGYVLYNTLNQDQIRVLSQDVNALAEPVSQVAAKVA
jgi:iron uptake system component EfeO